MNINFGDLLTLIIAPAATAILSWLLAMRKYKADVNTTELDNVEKSLAIYREMVEDLSKRLDGMSKRIDDLERDNLKLLEENRLLKKKVRSMGILIDKLKKINPNDESMGASEAKLS